MSRKSESNPFYALLVLTGVAFVITALAVVVAWVRVLEPSGPPGGTSELGPVLQFFDERGVPLMVWQAIALAILAMLAMGLDQWRHRGRSEPADGV